MATKKKEDATIEAIEEITAADVADLDLVLEDPPAEEAPGKVYEVVLEDLTARNLRDVVPPNKGDVYDGQVVHRVTDITPEEE